MTLAVYSFFAVVNGNLDFIRAFHDVIGRQNISVRRNDDAGTEALFLAREFAASFGIDRRKIGGKMGSFSNGLRMAAYATMRVE